MKKLSLVLIILMIVGICIPAVSAEEYSFTYEDPMFESMKIIIPLAIFGGVAIGFMKGWI